MSAVYAIALGGNRRTRDGDPAATLRAALVRVGGVVAVSPVIVTPPLGPSTRRFANAAALIASDEPPPSLLARLKRVERAMGRRPGRRWGARPIDLDIILWSGGAWRSHGLTVPHAAFRQRRFVLEPLAVVAGDWRDPITGFRIRHLLARTARRR